MSLDTTIEHGKKENHTGKLKQLTIPVEIMVVVAIVQNQDYIILKKENL